jgi:hypothetical protein
MRPMSPRRRKPRKPVGGGGARHPNSLANLQPGSGAPPGNSRALSHGGYAAIARERLDTRVREVFEALSADAPLRGHDGELPAADVVVVQNMAEAMCRRDDVRDNIRDYGLFDQKTGDLRPALDLERRLRREILKYADALGMTPRSRAALGLDLARTGSFDLARHWQDADAEEVVEGDAEEVGGDG